MTGIGQENFSGAPTFFKGRQRKIMPFELIEHPGENASEAELAQFSLEKAITLNRHILGYGSLAQNEWDVLGLPAPDLKRMQLYRLERIRDQLRKGDYSAAILCDPLNVRYATDSTNFQVFNAHNLARYAFVALEGPVIMFDYHNCEHISGHSHGVDEVRKGISTSYFSAGSAYKEAAQKWAKELADLIRSYGGGNHRVAVDVAGLNSLEALHALGVETGSGQEVMELARTIKSADELAAMRRAIAACEAAMAKMESSLKPGMSEWDMWAILHGENIRRGGEWIETQLLASGPRTNPWFQEASARVIEAGDLVAFDTDLVGPYGMCCDISRTWLCGEGKPGNEQRDLYARAYEQIQYNMELVTPGREFRELCFEAKSLPDAYLHNRYSVLYHGVGLCDEYPSIPYSCDWEVAGCDGALEVGQVICVESYVGRLGGREGVKLEEQVLVTENGPQCLSRYPFDDRLLD